MLESKQFTDLVIVVNNSDNQGNDEAEQIDSGLTDSDSEENRSNEDIAQNEADNKEIQTERKFYVHKAIVAARFPYFKQVLEENPQMSQIEIGNMKHEVFEAFLRFIYSGILDVHEDMYVPLLAVAHQVCHFSLMILQLSLTIELFRKSCNNVLLKALWKLGVVQQSFHYLTPDVAEKLAK